jgi:hypothetical protein
MALIPSHSFRSQADKPEVGRQLLVSVVFGPIFRELADLAVWHGGIRAVAQQSIDHVAATAERRVVQGGASEIEAGGDEVHLGAAIKEMLDRLGAPPGRRVNQGISEDLLRVATGN